MGSGDCVDTCGLLMRNRLRCLSFLELLEERMQLNEYAGGEFRSGLFGVSHGLLVVVYEVLLLACSEGGTVKDSLFENWDLDSRFGQQLKELEIRCFENKDALEKLRLDADVQVAANLFKTTAGLCEG
ncbi:hypothetical protein Droror1_Dr00017171 [Drosera rotundifolia]